MSTAAPTIAALLREGAAALPGEARRDAELLLCHALDRPRSWLFAHGDDVATPDQLRCYRGLLAARAAGRPVAHLLGRRGFWTLDLEVDASTLIPRPETELLVEAVLARLPSDAAVQVADLGTGSGAIALAIASERPRARLIAVDASTAALQVAARNAARLELLNVGFVHGDWFAPLAGLRFALIASNPPYIAADDPHLEQGDLRFEPRSALASGADGLDDIRRIVAGAPVHLERGGWLLLEHGWQQGGAVRALMREAGLSEVDSLCDLERRERVTVGRHV